MANHFFPSRFTCLYLRISLPIFLNGKQPESYLMDLKTTKC
jgi:hypothetical protein